MQRKTISGWQLRSCHKLEGHVPVIGWIWISSPCSPTAHPQPAWWVPLLRVLR